MRKHINLVILVFLLGAAFWLFKQNYELFLLFFSSSMGLVALSEMNVNWNDKVAFKDYMSNLRTGGYQTTIVGKIAGHVSMAALFVYFVNKYI